jgi:hypothetical protein
MLTIRAMSDGKGYSARYLEQRDYYAEGERVLGLWQGRGAELLGLSGDVRTEEFEALRQGGTYQLLYFHAPAVRRPGAFLSDVCEQFWTVNSTMGLLG